MLNIEDWVFIRSRCLRDVHYIRVNILEVRVLPTPTLYLPHILQRAIPLTYIIQVYLTTAALLRILSIFEFLKDMGLKSTKFEVFLAELALNIQHVEVCLDFRHRLPEGFPWLDNLTIKWTLILILPHIVPDALHTKVLSTS